MQPMRSNRRSKSRCECLRRVSRTALLAGVFASTGTSGLFAQANRPAQDPNMRSIQQALSLAQRGDARGALAIADELIAKHPDYAPAVKLKAMVLEESGRSTEAGAEYERG